MCFQLGFSYFWVQDHGKVLVFWKFLFLGKWYTEEFRSLTIITTITRITTTTRIIMMQLSPLLSFHLYYHYTSTITSPLLSLHLYYHFISSVILSNHLLLYLSLLWLELWIKFGPAEKYMTVLKSLTRASVRCFLCLIITAFT